jgi:peptidoglycan-associated lipoprotein
MTIRFLTLVLLASACRKSPAPVAVDDAVAPVPPAATAPDLDEVVERLTSHFARVHFELDSSALSPSALDALSTNAGILQRHPVLHVEVQGHADERGTSDYNLGLGDQRARNVVRALTEMGVPAARLKVISFGEERPAVEGAGEVAWSQNRRCEFRILDRTPDVEGTVGDDG